MQLSAWWRVAMSLVGVQLAAGYDYSEDVDFTDTYDDGVVETSPALDALTRVRRFDSSKEVEDMLKEIFVDRNLIFPTRVYKAVETRELTSSILEDTEYPTADEGDIMRRMRVSETEDQVVTEESTSQVMPLHDLKSGDNHSALLYDSNVTLGGASRDLEDTEYPSGNMDETMMTKNQLKDRPTLRNRDRVMTTEAFKSTDVMNTDDVSDESNSELTSSNLEDTEYPTSYVDDIKLMMTTRETEDRHTHKETSFLGQVMDDKNVTEDSSQSFSDVEVTKYTSSSEEYEPKMRTNEIKDHRALRAYNFPVLRNDPKPKITTTTTTMATTTTTTMATTTTTTTVTTSICSTTESDYITYNSTVMGKCFVCGLDTLRVPQFAHCADAFAGDFLPLTPVDTRAKGHIASFRKYCRYRDIDGYTINETLPRSIFGRWTGGCSVRWVDLSGIYTQRSCRNKDRPVLGLNYASKRMAKLELALTGLDNGCIISPIATLLPFSRGVSLFARFHACVRLLPKLYNLSNIKFKYYPCICMVK